MTVAADPAKGSPPAASWTSEGGTDGLQIDVRGPSPVLAGTVSYETADVVSGWHQHDLHQLQYALRGTAEVETAAGRYLLPPQQAIWIPAGLRHNTTLSHVASIAVFFDPVLVAEPGDRARVLPARPVLREMIAYATRWPIARPSSDPLADAFLEALARLVVELLDTEVALWLPSSTDPLIVAVMAQTCADLSAATATGVCRAVGLSERTLRRRFPVATGMTWQAYLTRARLLDAMAALASTDRTVLDVATGVGFESLSAFGRAFSRMTGETPSAYRRRVLRGRSDRVAPQP